MDLQQNQKQQNLISNNSRPEIPPKPGDRKKSIVNGAFNMDQEGSQISPDSVSLDMNVSIPTTVEEINDSSKNSISNKKDKISEEYGENNSNLNSKPALPPKPTSYRNSSGQNVRVSTSSTSNETNDPNFLRSKSPSPPPPTPPRLTGTFQKNITSSDSQKPKKIEEITPPSGGNPQLRLKMTPSDSKKSNIEEITAQPDGNPQLRLKMTPSDCQKSKKIQEIPTENPQLRPNITLSDSHPKKIEETTAPPGENLQLRLKMTPSDSEKPQKTQEIDEKLRRLSQSSSPLRPPPPFGRGYVRTTAGNVAGNLRNSNISNISLIPPPNSAGSIRGKFLFQTSPPIIGQSEAKRKSQSLGRNMGAPPSPLNFAPFSSGFSSTPLKRPVIPAFLNNISSNNTNNNNRNLRPSDSETKNVINSGSILAGKVPTPPPRLKKRLSSSSSIKSGPESPTSPTTTSTNTTTEVEKTLQEEVGPQLPLYSTVNLEKKWELRRQKFENEAQGENNEKPHLRGQKFGNEAQGEINEKPHLRGQKFEFEAQGEINEKPHLRGQKFENEAQGENNEKPHLRSQKFENDAQDENNEKPHLRGQKFENEAHGEINEKPVTVTPSQIHQIKVKENPDGKTNSSWLEKYLSTSNQQDENCNNNNYPGQNLADDHTKSDDKSFKISQKKSQKVDETKDFVKSDGDFDKSDELKENKSFLFYNQSIKWPENPQNIKEKLEEKSQICDQKIENNDQNSRNSNGNGNGCNIPRSVSFPSDELMKIAQNTDVGDSSLVSDILHTLGIQRKNSDDKSQNFQNSTQLLNPNGHFSRRRSWNCSESISSTNSSPSDCSSSTSSLRGIVQNFPFLKNGGKKDLQVSSSSASWNDEGDISTGALGDAENSDYAQFSSVDEVNSCNTGTGGNSGFRARGTAVGGSLGGANSRKKRFTSTLFGSFGKGPSSTSKNHQKRKIKTSTTPIIGHPVGRAISAQIQFSDAFNSHLIHQQTPQIGLNSATKDLNLKNRPQSLPASTSTSSHHGQQDMSEGQNLVKSNVSLPLDVNNTPPPDDTVHDDSSKDSGSINHDEILSELSAKGRQAYYVARELLTSERTFVDVLNLLTEDFPQFVHNAEEIMRVSVLPKPDMEFLLGGLPTLKAVNQDLICDLHDRISKWRELPKISDIIVKKGPFLKHYSTYILEFERISKKLDDSCLKYPRFKKVLMDFEMSERCQKLGIKHYMLKPVQRMPQYRLLLEDYLKNLDSNSEDYEDTVKAIAIVRQVAEHANRAIDLQMNAEKLLILQNRLSGNIMRPDRKLIKDGELLKVCRKVLQPRYFVLMNDCLLCMTYNAGSGSTRDLKLRYELPLTGMRIEVKETGDYRYEFSVISITRSFSLVAKSTKEMDDWLRTLNTAIDENKKKRVLQNVSEAEREFKVGKEAPVWIQDSRVTMCQLCTAEFTMTFRRHHCRACGKVVCGSCSGNHAPLEYQSFESARVCDDCYTYLLEEFDRENFERLSDQLELIRSRFKKVTSNVSKQKIKYKRTIPPRLDVHANNSESRMSGYLHWREREKRWKRNFFVLLENVLYFYAASEDIVAVRTVPILGYQLETASCDGFEGVEGNVFRLTHSGQNPITFQAESNTSAEKWVESLLESTVLKPESCSNPAEISDGNQVGEKCCGNERESIGKVLEIDGKIEKKPEIDHIYQEIVEKSEILNENEVKISPE